MEPPDRLRIGVETGRLGCVFVVRFTSFSGTFPSDLPPSSGLQFTRLVYDLSGRTDSGLRVESRLYNGHQCTRDHETRKCVNKYLCRSNVQRTVRENEDRDDIIRHSFPLVRPSPHTSFPIFICNWTDDLREVFGRPSPLLPMSRDPDHPHLGPLWTGSGFRRPLTLSPPSVRYILETRTPDPVDPRVKEISKIRVKEVGVVWGWR